jgi:hypothetical protein
MQNEVFLVRANRVGFVLGNLAFVASWLSLCVHLIRRWHLMDGLVRADIEYLIIIFLALWISLLFEKTKAPTLALVCASFWGVLTLVFRFS